MMKGKFEPKVETWHKQSAEFAAPILLNSMPESDDAANWGHT